ncbi:ubiquinol oxidase subunit II [Comamonas sp. NLF-1-9]|uniref:ubiquinol oxidase subunit II n=1 Tax=Comamonas sp. NLF-1-9 TaxID=2853163 RepID=UPI001C44F057|nr:ubiquinol oxidase subunit II [Comamonas sp. NLF-1-9]QXL84160.1 ubiquinol oxidase subunit II [Comamonas sp. NLF-1-9]
MVVAAGALGLADPAAAFEHLSFLDPQGPIAAAQRDHFWLVLAILFVFVAAPVFVGTLWLLVRYRYGAKGSKGAMYTPHWKFYKPLEFFNWGGPVVIVLFISVLVWHNAQRYDPYRAIASTAAAVPVQVVGYDWKWLFIYPDEGIATVGTLVLPVARPVAMELTSATVMQSFFIPALGSQIYAMGGMVTRLHLQADRPGRLLGENTMFNGEGFQQQRFPVAVVSEDDFRDWAARVRSEGRPLDAAALQALSARDTAARLRAALPQASAADGSVYLTQVPPDFFSGLVAATMKGQAVAPTALAGTAPVSEAR